MENANVTKLLIQYMRSSKINATQTAKDLGISESKLCPEGKEILTAAEFLELCNYLHIKPENLITTE